MPEGLKKLGLLTFNAWALDGYQKVFWYETGLADLMPQVMVLVAVTLVFLSRDPNARVEIGPRFVVRSHSR